MVDLLVPDVSHYQGTIDWAKLGAACPAVIVKAANDGHADKRFAVNRDGARAHCAVRGWYQYLTAGADPVAAARALMAIVGPLQPGEFFVLDLEEGGGDQSGRMNAWNARIPGGELDYSGLAFWREHLAHADAKARWVAAYRGTEPTGSHVLWQNTDRHRFPGIARPCDGSIFHGTATQLVAAILGAGPNAKPVHLPFPGGMTLGDVDEHVVALRYLLAGAGYGAFLTVHGHQAAMTYDKPLRDTVAAVQQLHHERFPNDGWRVSGECGPETWAWICELVTLHQALAA